MDTGERLEQLASFSNTLGNTNYTLYGPYNIIEFKATSNLAVVFTVSNDNNNPTTFKIDDVSLKLGFY